MFFTAPVVSCSEQAEVKAIYTYLLVFIFILQFEDCAQSNVKIISTPDWIIFWHSVEKLSLDLYV